MIKHALKRLQNYHSGILLNTHCNADVCACTVAELAPEILVVTSLTVPSIINRRGGIFRGIPNRLVFWHVFTRVDHIRENSMTDSKSDVHNTWN